MFSHPHPICIWIWTSAFYQMNLYYKDKNINSCVSASLKYARNMSVNSYEYLSVAVIKMMLCFLPELLHKQFQNVIPSANVFWKQHKPSFFSSGVSFTFVSVISLNEARKRTTSPFSFFIGTISKRHQNGDPATATEIVSKALF